MKSYTQEKSEKDIIKKIKEALDNLDELNINNSLKAELIFDNIKGKENDQVSSS